MAKIDELLEEYAFLDADDRYRLLIELGRDLEPMPDALKTDATLVRGCSASVFSASGMGSRSRPSSISRR